MNFTCTYAAFKTFVNAFASIRSPLVYWTVAGNTTLVVALRDALYTCVIASSDSATLADFAAQPWYSASNQVDNAAAYAFFYNQS